MRWGRAFGINHEPEVGARKRKACSLHQRPPQPWQGSQPNYRRIGVARRVIGRRGELLFAKTLSPPKKLSCMDAASPSHSGWDDRPRCSQESRGPHGGWRDATLRTESAGKGHICYCTFRLAGRPADATSSPYDGEETIRSNQNSPGRPIAAARITDACQRALITKMVGKVAVLALTKPEVFTSK